MNLARFNKDDVANETYIKLVRNKAHMGPVSEEKIALARASRLSTAANKVRVTAGFTVKVDTDNSHGSPKISHNQSLRIIGLDDDSPRSTAEYAVLLMQAWDNVFKNDGSSEYMNKLAIALNARASAYKKLGINPASDDKPNLSADQRMVYNSVVGPTGFDYYEYHLAFKLAGQKKFIRSRTVRTIQPKELDQILKVLEPEVAKLRNKITISIGHTN